MKNETWYSIRNLLPTLIFSIVFMLLCLFGVWRRVGRKIDYQKTLEEW